jgi:hypothetical protein
MNPDPEDTSPATQRLEAYLESLRDDPPRPGADLAPSILRRARWQRAIRAPLRAAATLVVALADGVTILLGAGRGGRS